MKIYQIHERFGDYENYRDYIVGSYLNKEKATTKMNELQRIEADRRVKAEHCRDCPIDDEDTIDDTLDTVVKRCSLYCKDAKITEEFYGYDCENYCCSWDDIDYEIKEVEVEE